MGLRQVSLNDRFDLNRSTILMNGTQALVRLMLMQGARDAAMGHKTAGYVSGYRGSPLGAVDQQMLRAKSVLEQSNVTFQPGLNEDLAATAIWGTQQAELRGEGKYDGVFGLWYGKGPGVDRSGDVFRHANMAGTSKLGGVLVAMGDDHTGESSTTCHQSDWAIIDAYMPVLSPAGVQEILDFGLYGFELSRFAGVWAGLKVMKDTIEVTSVVDGRPERMRFVQPKIEMPPGGLNIRLEDHWIAQEERMIDHKRFAAQAFAKANRIDKRLWGKPGAKIGFVAAGKNWLDLVHAFSLLNVDRDEAERLGITLYKIGQTFPLDMDSFHDWAEGLDLIVVVEEKRKLIEVQVKEAIFDDRKGRRVYGWRKGVREEELFPTRMALDPVMIAEKIGQILIEEGRKTDGIVAGLNALQEAKKAESQEEIAVRTPYFCAGCPHNTSTVLPRGARAYAGIGCHIMALWMDRSTSGFTHMGGEGANWIGEAPFSNRDHVFQNIGDGTYNHSGVLAIRAAIAAGTNITYKILFNDAVAMTGGQSNDGDLSPEQIIRELQAMGVENIALVSDPKEEINFRSYPKGIEKFERDSLAEVQRKYATISGVSAIVFVQTCAAEKRRRRKRGQFPDPDKRVFINTDVCEGCGDCGVQSNCVAIVPVETSLGRKRAVDQSACNKDFSCLKGFCPSFVTVEGGTIKKEAKATVSIQNLPEPKLPKIEGTHNVVITGVGGTGVVTIGAILAMAAHIDNKAAGMMEMAGLAQKGGAVHIHCRIANTAEDISAIRVATGECDALVGGDLVVSAGAKTIGLVKTGSAGGVVNSHEIITGDFTRDTDFTIPARKLADALSDQFADRLEMFDASELARVLMGDTIYSNMIVFGACWQKGLIPAGLGALLKAIELNGTSVETNKRAFEIGRWSFLNRDKVDELLAPEKPIVHETLEAIIEHRTRHIVAYQGTRLAKKYRKFVDQFEDATVKRAVAEGYHKLLTYKDEYEVARLLKDTRSKAEGTFSGDYKLTYHLAPPVLSTVGDSGGRPRKITFGSWVEKAYVVLAKFRFLRGTPLDVFGYSGERRMERGLIRQYEADFKKILEDGTVGAAPIQALAELPLQIRGFGPVKKENAARAELKRLELLRAIDTEDTDQREAAE